MIKSTTPKETSGTTTKAGQKAQKKKWDEKLGQPLLLYMANSIGTTTKSGSTAKPKPYDDYYLRMIFFLNVKKYVYFHRKEFRRIADYPLHVAQFWNQLT